MDRTLIWQLALRYLRGKRSGNAVPILSRISMVAIAVSSAAMIIVFSVFNGMESLVKDLYRSFYADVRVTVVRGKFFAADAHQLQAIKQIKGVSNITTVIEDNVIVNNANNAEQKVVTLKGIDNNYLNVNALREYIIGDDTVSAGKLYTGIGGIHILNELGADINNIFSLVELFYANPEVANFAADPEGAYRSLRLHPAGAFHVSDDFDDKYILAPLPLVQGLFGQLGRFSSIEISADPDAVPEVKRQLQQLFGNAYRVETRYEQNKTMYAVIGGEKWAIYAILVMVLLVASFNMVGALSMLVMEKQKDIAILKAMGVLPGSIKKIFLLEGVLWSLVGGISGIILGIILCLLQQRFGFVSLGGSFLKDAYPVELQLTDHLLVVGTIIVVGLLAAWYPSRKATQVIDPTLKAAG